MKIIKIDVLQGQYCLECGMPDRFLISLADNLFCLDCLDRAIKMMLSRIQGNEQKGR